MSEDRSPYRAYVGIDYPMRGVAIHLVEDHGSEDRVIHWNPDGSRLSVDPAAASETLSPTLRMHEGMARSLLEALARYFGGVSETQTLRQDYLAERARVDKFIERAVNPIVIDHR